MDETKVTPFSFSYPSEKCEIEFSKTTTHGLDHDHFYLKIKGKNLEECRKHFDELKQELVK